MIRSRVSRCLICLWIGLFLPVVAFAAEPVAIRGQDDPAFSKALEHWLSGREDMALPQLASLAAGGNAAAQILLGLIDTTPPLQGTWLAEQTRAERIALLRAPGGFSGVNWMRVAALTEPLAKVWLRLWSGDAEVQVILDFARLGEGRASLLAAKTLALREKTGFSAIATDPDFPPRAKVLALREMQRQDPSRTETALDALPPGDPARVLLGAPAPSDTARDDWLAITPELFALRLGLATLCPGAESRLADQRAAIAAIGGWWGLAEIGSPVAALIDEDRWARSRMNLLAIPQFFRPFDLAKGQTSGSRCIDFLSGLTLADQREAATRRTKKKGP